MTTTTHLTTAPTIAAADKTANDTTARRARRLLRFDGVAGLTAGAVALAAAPTLASDLDVGTTAVRIVATGLVVLGADALIVAQVRGRRFPTTTRAFVIGRELIVVLALVVALVQGAPAAAIAVLAALVVDAVVFGALEMAAAPKRAEPTSAQVRQGG